MKKREREKGVDLDEKQAPFDVFIFAKRSSVFILKRTLFRYANGRRISRERVKLRAINSCVVRG